jgi:transposase
MGEKEMRILSKNQRYEIYMLLKHGFSQHRISKKLGIHRLTIRRYQRQWALGQSVPGWPPGNSEQQAHLPDGTGGAVGCPVDESVPPRPPGNNGDSAAEQKAGIAQPSLGAKRIITQSACERYRDFIEQQTGHGRNAQAIYQDLVDGFGFSCKYNSVKRFVKKLKAVDPKRFDILEFAPGEEAQVDYGQGALTVYSNGKMKRPYLFVMTLKYSGKCYREVVWHTNQETWAKLHEKAFRHLGGCPRYVVLDNLKEGVIKPDIYEPELNATYAAMLQHYGVVAQPCRVRDPNRKGAVERAVQHAQDTPLKGKRFESVEEQNAYLHSWESKWADTRLHGSKKRRVIDMFNEEKPHLLPLPAAGFRTFVEEERGVDDAGMVQVKCNYYFAGAVPLYLPVKVRIYADEIVVLTLEGTITKRHPRQEGKGKRIIDAKDMIYNPSRQTAHILQRINLIGVNAKAFADMLLERDGRLCHGILYGVVRLVQDWEKQDIERVCGIAVDRGCPSYKFIKRYLEQTAIPRGAMPIKLQQHGPEIRPASVYQQFWERNARSNTEENPNGDVIN